jgi:hypothetical protein
MWTALIAPVAGLITDWFKGQRAKTEAKHKAQMEVLGNTALWEQKMAEASNNSWKDEWFTILLSMPIVAIIYGVLMDSERVIYRVGLAFNQLDSLPEWYQYLLFVAVLASFGIRSADKISTLLQKR